MMEEGIPDNERYFVELPEFEGPLDLLLHLVKRHELDIINIPISFITQKYLEYLDLMRALNLDVAGEYLLMAATLAHIKSRELLPQAQEEEEEENPEDGPDPKEELIRRLLEYQKYREASASLAERPTLGRTIFRRGVPMDPVNPKELPLAEVSIFALVTALAEVLKRNQVDLTHDVEVDRISISDRINQIVDLLESQETVRFTECFSLATHAAQIRHEIVVTFLAILEMTKLKMIRILQHMTAGEIYLSSTVNLKAIKDGEEEKLSFQ